MNIPDTPTVLINNMIAEFKAEGYDNTNLQVVGSTGSKKVILSFLKTVETKEEKQEENTDGGN